MYKPEDYYKGIIVAQFTLTNMWAEYWRNYLDGFMENYEREVRKAIETSDGEPRIKRRKKRRN